MTWKRERDLLIAQTMAFVQSVTGKPPEAEASVETRLPSASPDEAPAVGRPADVLPARLSASSQGDLRDEIHRRVAAFRARQQVFARDRNEYCEAMMAKARASSERTVKIRHPQPPKD